MIHKRFKFTVVNVKDWCYLASSWIYTMNEEIFSKYFTEGTTRMIGIILCFNSWISSIAHKTDLIFNIRVLSVSLNSICFSVYRRKKLMSIKLVHIKRVYELLPSRPRDKTQITSISCTGKQIIYWLCHLGINIHFNKHCHQLLLFMTEVGERTLEEVLISVLIRSIHKSRNCYTGYSSYYWDKSVPPMMMGITEKLL